MSDLNAHEIRYGQLMNAPVMQDEPEESCLICNRTLSRDEVTLCDECGSDEENMSN